MTGGLYGFSGLSGRSGRSGRSGSTAYHSIGTGRGTGNPVTKVTREDLRAYAKQQEAKKKADREKAISSLARAIRVKSARDFQQRKIKTTRNKKQPYANLLGNAEMIVGNALFGKRPIITDEEAKERATKEVNKKMAAEEAAATDAIRKDFATHGIGGGRKTKKHRNKKNKTKRRR